MCDAELYLLITSYRNMIKDNRDFTNPIIEIAARIFLMPATKVVIFCLNTEQQQGWSFSSSIFTSILATFDEDGSVSRFGFKISCISALSLNSMPLVLSPVFLCRQQLKLRNLLDPALIYHKVTHE